MPDCHRCFGPLDIDALTCPRCQTLVHQVELERLKAAAQALEAEGRYQQSRELWVKVLHYLPPNTRQAAWVVDHVHQITDLPDSVPGDAPAKATGWLAKLGPLAPLLIVLFKGKGLLSLLNAKSLLSLGAFAALYADQFGVWYGIGLAILILIHELGHYVDIRRRGLPADMPVFLPGIGAYVRWRALGVPDVTRAEVSLAGPLAGVLAGVACVMLWWVTGSGFWVAMARSGAWLNAFNLIPVWALDGGQAAKVLDRGERVAVLSLSVALWLLLGESVFLLVAAGATWRLFTKDLPAAPSRRTTVYFLSLLAGLGLVLRLVPGEGLGL